MIEVGKGFHMCRKPFSLEEKQIREGMLEVYKIINSMEKIAWIQDDL